MPIFLELLRRSIFSAIFILGIVIGMSMNKGVLQSLLYESLFTVANDAEVVGD
jgi:hypothetical protein